MYTTAETVLTPVNRMIARDRELIENAVRDAITIVDLLSNAPRGQSYWFKSKYVQNLFKTFFGRHNLEYLRKFRQILQKCQHGGVIHIDLVSKRALKSLIKDKILENTIYI